MNSIAQYQDQIDTEWLQYFSIKKALATVGNHIEGLASTSTPERHTFDAYQRGLKYFLNWSGPQLTGAHYNDASIIDIAKLIMAHGAHLPSKPVIQAFIGHLKKKGLASSTIASKYMAPVRHYLDALNDQHIKATGETREYVYDCKQRILSARSVKNPPKETTTDKSALESYGTRLSYAQMSELFEKLKRDSKSLQGMRDFALILIAFDTGLRVAELQRMTLSCISREEGVYEVTVRGKRGNMSPVSLSDRPYEIMMQYIDLYNAGLDHHDPRRIDADTPIWQPLLHHSNYCKVGVNKYDPQQGMSTNAIRSTFQRVTKKHLGFAIQPHDARRTVAKILKDKDAPLENIQSKLRHSSLATTAIYIGKKRDLKSTRTDQYLNYDI